MISKKTPCRSDILIVTEYTGHGDYLVTRFVLILSVRSTCSCVHINIVFIRTWFHGIPQSWLRISSVERDGLFADNRYPVTYIFSDVSRKFLSRASIQGLLVELSLANYYSVLRVISAVCCTCAIHFVEFHDRFFSTPIRGQNADNPWSQARAKEGGVYQRRISNFSRTKTWPR